MPILTTEGRQIEWAEAGAGRPVVLLHCSAGGHHQWQMLAVALQDHRRVIAPNLYGYGATSPWPGPAAQRVADQAALVRLVLAETGCAGMPLDIVGHSFGALVAIETALTPGLRVEGVVAFEPNPFALLGSAGHAAEAAIVARLEGLVRAAGRGGDWTAAAEAFADFFTGPGSWAALPRARQDALIAALAPNPAEWDAVTDPSLRPDRWSAIDSHVLLGWAADSPAPLLRLVDVLRAANPRWESWEADRGGHMAPVVRPRAFVQRVLAHLAHGRNPP